MTMTREQQIAALEKDWAENPRWKLKARLQRRRRRSSARQPAARVYPGEEWRREAVGEGQRWCEEGLCQRVWRHHCRPGHAAGQGRPRGRICPAGRLPPTATLPKPCTRTSRSTPMTRYRRWFAASTTPSSAPTRFNGVAASIRATRNSSTTSCPSLPMRKPVSAAC